MSSKLFLHDLIGRRERESRRPFHRWPRIMFRSQLIAGLWLDGESGKALRDSWHTIQRWIGPDGVRPLDIRMGGVTEAMQEMILFGLAHDWFDRETNGLQAQYLQRLILTGPRRLLPRYLPSSLLSARPREAADWDFYDEEELSQRVPVGRYEEEDSAQEPFWFQSWRTVAANYPIYALLLRAAEVNPVTAWSSMIGTLPLTRGFMSVLRHVRDLPLFIDIEDKMIRHEFVEVEKYFSDNASKLLKPLMDLDEILNEEIPWLIGQELMSGWPTLDRSQESESERDRANRALILLQTAVDGSLGRAKVALEEFERHLISPSIV